MADYLMITTREGASHQAKRGHEPPSQPQPLSGAAQCLPHASTWPNARLHVRLNADRTLHIDAGNQRLGHGRHDNQTTQHLLGWGRERPELTGAQVPVTTMHFCCARMQPYSAHRPTTCNNLLCELHDNNSTDASTRERANKTQHAANAMTSAT